jgi:hypothetical protein
VYGRAGISILFLTVVSLLWNGSRSSEGGTGVGVKVLEGRD